MKIGRILLLIIILIVSLFTLTGCTISESKIEDRFIKIEETNSYEIFYDKETNVEYITIYTGHGVSAYTVLVDSEGKPLLYNDN